MADKSLTNVDVTHSRVELRISLSDVNCGHAVWNETALHSSNIFCAPTNCLVSVLNTVSRFSCPWRLYYTFIVFFIFFNMAPVRSAQCESTGPAVLLIRE